MTSVAFSELWFINFYLPGVPNFIGEQSLLDGWDVNLDINEVQWW
jgi:hypothetical protein